MDKTSLSHTFFGVYVLVESLQVELKPLFYLTFFLTERMQNLLYLKKYIYPDGADVLHKYLVL